MNIIQRLNELRLERNLSVYRLAELSGINQSTLANTFSRRTIPSVKHLEQICDTFGITLAQFFSDDETEMHLTTREKQMITNYRKLPEPIKQSIAKLVEDIPNVQN